MQLREWVRPPRYWLTLFLAVALVLALALGWLSWRLVRQDQALESQRIQEHLNYAADLIATALARKLSDTEARLAELLVLPDAGLNAKASDLAKSLDDDSLVIVLRLQSVQAYPETRLLFYPLLPRSREAPPAIFATGEAAEFKENNYAKAIVKFQGLARSPDPAIRAAALLRLGRNYRKARQPDRALAAYNELRQLGSIPIGELPAELLARYSRCVLLEELARRRELDREAADLYADLQNGRWTLTRASYEFYAQQTRRWSRPDASLELRAQGSQALAEGVEWLWAERSRIRLGDAPSAGRRSVWVQNRPVLLAWRSTSDRLVAQIVGPQYFKKQWLTVLQPIADLERVRFALTDDNGHPALGPSAETNSYEAVRAPEATHLPWTLRVGSADPRAEIAEYARRRRLLLGSLTLIASLVLVGTYFITRAVSKELAVAQLQSDFVSAVSHEFRTPLASLRQLSELLADGRVPSEERRLAYYAGLRRETERLQRLVEGLLEFGRIEAGAREYEFEPMDPAILVRRVAEDFAQHLSENGYQIDIQVEPSLAPIRVDTEAISRALWNLLDNAVKYSPGCKIIRIGAIRLNDQVAISVRDQGLGIPLNERKRIFNKFVRGANAKTAGAPGTGLGLAMVEHIVRAHGGEITVESQVGAGSAFTILLPVGKE